MESKNLASIFINRHNITLRQYKESSWGIRQLKCGKFPWWQSRVAFDMGYISLLFEYY
jgi:hypothetical protein